jgi:DNA polymerase iota
MNKPNQQTVLVPSCTVTFMASLRDLRKITGIGTKTAELLEEINIKTIEELQDCELDVLKKKFGYETAVKLKDMSFGRDFSLVRPSGKPKSIGLEDSCKPISIKGDVEEKFRMLLTRLVKQISEDGRIPVTVKVTVRKVDAKKQSHRETKQCNVLASLFRTMNGRVFLADGANEKLLKIVMRLFERSVDLKQPFNITLLGLAFTKFQERQSGPKSIANFLIKKSDVEVQSITNLCNVAAPTEPNLETARFKNSSSPLSMDYDTRSETSLASLSGSESEIEPSPKKTRFGLLIAKRRCLSNASLGSMEDISSPSKLKVADLRLNSKEFDREWPSPKSNGSCVASTSAASNAPSTPTTSHHHKLFQQLAKKNIAVASQLQQSTPTTRQRSTVMPTDVDPNVFKELPLDMQKELLSTWRAASSGVATTATIVKQNLTKSTINGNKSTSAAGKKKGTLHRYFIRSDVNTQ